MRGEFVCKNANAEQSEWLQTTWNGRWAAPVTWHYCSESQKENAEICALFQVAQCGRSGMNNLLSLFHCYYLTQRSPVNQRTNTDNHCFKHLANGLFDLQAK